MLNRIEQKVHASISHQELSSAGMRRSETNFRRPIAEEFAVVWTVSVACVVVYGYQSRAISVAIIGVGPAAADMLRAAWSHFSEEDRFR
jgi:hypothetical protein